MPTRLSSNTVVKHEEGKFSVEVSGKTHQIKSYDLSGLPLDLTEEKLKLLLNDGKLSLKQIGDDYGLEA